MPQLPSKVLLKRRKEGDAGSGPPSTLLNGELGFDENEQVLYYGSGNDGRGNALHILPIAGGFTALIKDAQLYAPSTPLTESQDYLIVNINGVEKAIRLFDL
jgi:hypothetical protein